MEARTGHPVCSLRLPGLTRARSIALCAHVHVRGVQRCAACLSRSLPHSGPCARVRAWPCSAEPSSPSR